MSEDEKLDKFHAHLDKEKDYFKKNARLFYGMSIQAKEKGYPIGALYAKAMGEIYERAFNELCRLEADIFKR